MSGFIPAEEDLTESSDSSPFWWECSSETDEDGDSSTSFSSFTSSTSSRGSDNDKKQYDTSHWLACQDQDNASLGCSSSDEDSYEASISSASSVCSDEDGKYFIEAEDEDEESFGEGEKYLVALGWWKVYRSGWWELSNGAKTHFEESYVDYRFATHLLSIPEEGEGDGVDSP
ncbi:hypothetical protein Q9L58_009924 [Maublancomyces gigas]|uniref:Uncharacterized protein n=1 Tax=Discina gigas TaxID=1032678 RepID=A0ABR3G5Z6_9PEZI